MSTRGQQITKTVYETPEIVEAYIQRNAIQLKQAENIRKFSKTLSGKKILDLGCGPGHESHLFAELGFDVTGFDYSQQMIKRAKALKPDRTNPTFIIGDMRRLTNYFSKDSFDGIWANASLLHISPEEIGATLHGITTVAKNNARVFVRVKGGHDETTLVTEEKYGSKTQREFTLWSKDTFVTLAKKYGWQLDNFTNVAGSIFQGKPTNWLELSFTVNK